MPPAGRFTGMVQPKFDSCPRDGLWISRVAICFFLLISWNGFAATPLRFTRHKIATYPGGYQAAVFDVNGDGHLDVIALSTDRNRVDWFENPTWKPRQIAAVPHPMDVAPRDLDGNGKCELAVASGFYWDQPSKGGEVELFNGKAPNDTNLWSSTPLARQPVAHRLRWGKLMGGDEVQLIQAPILGAESEYQPNGPKPFNGQVHISPSHLWAYRVPKDFTQTPWQILEIDNSLHLLHGIYVGALEPGKADSVLTASMEGIYRFDFAPQSPGKHWLKQQIAQGEQLPAGQPSGASEVVAGRLGANRPFIASVEPWHGELLVVYTPSPDGGLWQRQVIDTSLREGHALLAVDLDRDGRDEIVAGWRGGNGGVAVYCATDNAGKHWEKEIVDQNIQVECLVAADINADGLVDLVANSGRHSNLLVWYEQQKK